MHSIDAYLSPSGTSYPDWFTQYHWECILALILFSERASSFFMFFGVSTRHGTTLNETVFLVGSFLSSLLLHLAFRMSR